MPKRLIATSENQRLIANLYDSGRSDHEIAQTIGRPAIEVERTLGYLRRRGFLSFWHRRLVAIHESGHAVAIAMRGHQIIAIDVWPDHASDGHVTHGKLGRDTAFASFAGIWAEARYRWEWDEIYEEGGVGFDVYLADQLAQDTTDGRVVYRAIAQRRRKKAAALYETRLSDDEVARIATELEELKRDEASKFALWDAELEGVWAVVNQVADRLQDDRSVTTEDIRELLGP